MKRIQFPSQQWSRLDQPRLVIGSALVCIAALAWAYTIWMAETISDPSMGSMGTSSMNMRLGVSTADGTLGLAAFLPMWTGMMAAMMFPSAEPMFSIFHRVQNQRSARGDKAVSPLLFGLGYLCVWAVLGAPALLLNVGLEEAAKNSGAINNAAPYAAGLILLGAAVYQLTPWKYQCLSHCRTPLNFVMSHWREGRTGALRMGAHHGLYCIGCCWALMAVLFVVGVMNLAWMALLTVVIFLERVTPWGKQVVYATSGILGIFSFLVLLDATRV